MYAFRKFLAASAAVVSLAAFAAPASALELINVGSANNNESLNAFVWAQGATPGTGTLSVVDRLVSLNFRDALFDDNSGQDAYLTFLGTADGSTLQTEADGTYRQTGLDGSFQFRTAAAGGGNLLLAGVFTDAWLTGRDATGSFMTVLDGGSLELSSGIIDLSWLINDNASFSFSNVTNGFADLGADGALDGFVAQGFSATFSGAAGVVPEPGAWALMIVGFGAAGAMLRSRRRMALATA